MARAQALSRRGLLLGGMAGSATLVVGQARAADALELAVVVNAANSERLTAADIEQIYRSSRRFWPGGKPIVAFNLVPGSPERVAFDRAVLRLEPEAVSRYWIDRKIRGGEPAPRAVPNAALVPRLVTQLANGIGYVPASLVVSGLRVVGRVRARDLLITSGSLLDWTETV